MKEGKSASPGMLPLAWTDNLIRYHLEADVESQVGFDDWKLDPKERAFLEFLLRSL